MWNLAILFLFFCKCFTKWKMEFVVNIPRALNEIARPNKLEEIGRNHRPDFCAKMIWILDCLKLSLSVKWLAGIILWWYIDRETKHPCESPKDIFIYKILKELISNGTLINTNRNEYWKWFLTHISDVVLMNTLYVSAEIRC